MNGITRRQRLVKPFQHDNADAIPPDCALGLGVKGPTVTIRGEDHAFLVEITTLLWYMNRNSTGQDHIRLIAQQTLDRQTDRHQSRRTGGVDINARPGQVE